MEMYLLAAAALTTSAPVPEPNPAGGYAVELLGAGGGLALAVLIIKTIMDLVKGRADTEITRNASLTQQRDTAWRERDEEREARLASEAQLSTARRVAEAKADCEARNARKLWDYAARLRRELFLAGIDPKALEPELEQCERITEHTIR